MNIILWIIQALLATAFFGAGAMKLATPRDQLIARPPMAWAADFTSEQIKAVGLAEVVCAIGLVLPWAIEFAPILTPVAAAVLVAIMIGAVWTHLRRREPAVPALALGVLAAIVAVSRFSQL